MKKSKTCAFQSFFADKMYEAGQFFFCFVEKRASRQKYKVPKLLQTGLE